jgi:hypothetical protein
LTRRKKKIQNMELIVQFLASGQGLPHLGMMSDRTIERYLEELVEKQIITTHSPTHKFTEWAKRCEADRGSRFLVGSRAHEYMKLYYKKRIMYILNHQGGSAPLGDLKQLLCSPRSSFFNDTFCSLNDHQFYSYIFELCRDNTTDMADFSEHPSLWTLGSFRRHYSSSEERNSLIILFDRVRNLPRGKKAKGEAVAAQGAGKGAEFRAETPGEERPSGDGAETGRRRPATRRRE